MAYPLAAHIVVLVGHDGAVHLREQVGRLDQVDGLLEVLLVRVRVRVRARVRVRVLQCAFTSQNLRSISMNAANLG